MKARKNKTEIGNISVTTIRDAIGTDENFSGGLRIAQGLFL